jgi:hypothetical protein
MEVPMASYFITGSPAGAGICAEAGIPSRANRAIEP